MDLKMPKGVLFDLDGTLLDSAPDFIASLDNLLTKYNQPKLDPEIITRLDVRTSISSVEFPESNISTSNGHSSNGKCSKVLSS